MLNQEWMETQREIKTKSPETLCERFTVLIATLSSKQLPDKLIRKNIFAAICFNF